ncbi:MAG: TnpV protein [Clostridia bacterium]|nr:TnpV protein [Clostridia bacterium]
MKQSLYEQNGGTFREENGHLIPNLALPESNEQPIGKYGLVHLDYLKKYRRGTYTALLTEGRLNAYLADIDRQAKEMLDLIITQTAERERVNEDLKAKDQLKWVQMMNNIRASAEEVLLSTLVGM